MSLFSRNILVGASGAQGYQISRSVRLRSSASAYFNRTPASASNRKTWTWSGWVKRGKLGTSQVLFEAGNPAGTLIGDLFLLQFTSGDILRFDIPTVGATTTTAVFRDPSAWYHVVVAMDTTQATSANRTKIYINGVQQVLSAQPSITQNADLAVNNNVAHYHGRYDGSSLWFDGYLTEVNFIDGQALTPSSFGQFNAVTGVWQPIKYAGTYGTNGFYLNFSDNSNNTAATIGKDWSGNGNNWTPNNISVTAGATYDSMIDTPTPFADGGNGRGNYAVLNPLLENSWWAAPVRASITNGNLNATASANDQAAFSNWDIPTDTKVYLEVTANGSNTSNTILVAAKSRATFEVGYYQNGLKQINGNTSTSYGASWTTNDVIGIAIDRANNSITFYKNGVSQGEIINTFPSQTVLVGCYLVTSGQSMTFNFGQRPFAYTPPTGFKALNTQNLPEPTIKKGNQYFDATLWTGNGGTQSIVNAGGFQPDLVWAKDRSTTNFHALYDAVRGATKVIQSNTTTAEQTFATGLTSFNSNGFTTGSNSDTNTNGNSYVGWQWKANGAGVTNTDGSITSTVSANTTSGFSVVTYTGTGANATVGHGLGVALKFIIAKRRNASVNWFVGSGALPSWSYALEGLNTTSAANSGATAVWNSTAPTSSVFSIGTDLSASGGTYVAYCFSEVAGYSKFGSYVGNGSADGPFVYCGFRPRWIMVKSSTSAQDWKLLDTARNTYNSTDSLIAANTSGAEDTNAVYNFDILSNGFKPRNTYGYANTSGATYIYAAFSEVGFKYALGR